MHCHQLWCLIAILLCPGEHFESSSVAAASATGHLDGAILTGDTSWLSTRQGVSRQMYMDGNSQKLLWCWPSYVQYCTPGQHFFAEV